MKESPERHINPFLSDVENDKVNLDDGKFQKSLEPSNVPSESFHKAKEVYIDKNVTECQLPEMVTCYEEMSGFNVVKDICVDEGLSHGEMIKCDKEHHELSCNSNGDKHDHMIDDRINHMVKDDLDTKLISAPLEDKLKLFVESNIANSKENFIPDNTMQNGQEKLDSGSSSLNNSIRILEPANNSDDEVGQQLSEVCNYVFPYTTKFANRDPFLINHNSSRPADEINGSKLTPLPVMIIILQICFIQAQLAGCEANEPSQTDRTIDNQSETMMEENTTSSADTVKPTTNSGPQEHPLSTESAPNHHDLALSSITVAPHGGGESSFSMAAPVSGLITYSGPITAFGSISHRSDGSNASVRSFAFPILQNEWNSSPVRMAKADPKQSRKHRGWWQGFICCRF
ncbi:hypothetical protein SSX86_007066 [Deinandra increscens subsp. villosa]|uniref:Uncharacterized protein n=1 Tax=Deinandra increscens subsp. villosa TaxID=3103831 RepID=A0AAP0DP04_9ASTR